MPINPAPFGVPIAEDARIQSPWQTWMQNVWDALKGWRLTTYTRVEDGVTVLSIGAQASLTTNKTVPGARTATTGVLAISNADYGDGVIYSARVSANDTVELRFHNYSSSSKNVTIGTFDFILFAQ